MDIKKLNIHTEPGIYIPEEGIGIRIKELFTQLNTATKY